MSIPYDEAPGSTRRTRTSWTARCGTWRTRRRTKRPLLLHYHPLVIYRFQVLKQADVVLALFLQGDQFTLEQKRADFEYYDPITTGDSTLSGVVQSIIAAEVGYRELALRYFHQALFVDLADLHGNTATACTSPRPAASGTRWSTASAGCATTTASITFDPRLPEAWDGADLPDHPARHPAAGRADAATDRLHRRSTGEQAELTVRGTTCVVSADDAGPVPLADQGPRIDGPLPSVTATAAPTAP